MKKKVLEIRRTRIRADNCFYLEGLCVYPPKATKTRRNRLNERDKKDKNYVLTIRVGTKNNVYIFANGKVLNYKKKYLDKYLGIAGVLIPKTIRTFDKKGNPMFVKEMFLWATDIRIVDEEPSNLNKKRDVFCSGDILPF